MTFAKWLGAIAGIIAALVFFGGIIGTFGLEIVGAFTPIHFINYSQGERTGLINKISYKGLICKRYEGYMLVGNGNNVDPEEFDFTIKDPAIAKQVEALSGQIAKLQYQEYFYTSGCWGSTKYEITGVSQ